MHGVALFGTKRSSCACNSSFHLEKEKNKPIDLSTSKQNMTMEEKLIPSGTFQLNSNSIR
jgi:hypothetical protein